MLLDLDVARDRVVGGCAVGKWYAPVVDCVLLRCRLPFWVGFGPAEGDSLRVESVKMVEDRLEKREFDWVL